MDIPQAISPDQLMQRDAPFYSSHPDPAAGQIWARKQRTTWQTIDRFNCISSSIGFGDEVLLSFHHFFWPLQAAGLLREIKNITRK